MKKTVLFLAFSMALSLSSFAFNGRAMNGLPVHSHLMHYQAGSPVVSVVDSFKQAHTHLKASEGSATAAAIEKKNEKKRALRSFFRQAFINIGNAFTSNNFWN